MICVWPKPLYKHIFIGGSTYIFSNNTLLNPFVLEACLQRHGVHATSAAVISGRQPILLDTFQLRVSPREEVAIYLGRKEHCKSDYQIIFVIVPTHPLPSGVFSWMMRWAQSCGFGGSRRPFWNWAELRLITANKQTLAILNAFIFFFLGFLVSLSAHWHSHALSFLSSKNCS